ncbi:MAG: PTS sugar transporter subunit IIA [Deltaproteobacteria bacterium]|nr:MAG: PTS sugar transporter subunit IIA [Deltaproteobacteria bacterium]
MEIIEILNKDTIIADLKATDKEGVIQELAAILASKHQEVERDLLVRVLLEREKLGSTGIGEGIAIPHGKLANIESLLVAFGRSLTGIDFEAADGRPAKLFFLLVAPENSVGRHVKALANISHLLKDASLREKLLQAGSKEEIYQIIRDSEESES